VLEPWKDGLRSIARTGAPGLDQVPRLLSSQRWMLEAAGIQSGGVDGTMRAVGLASVYGSVFRTWLDDDDPGLARTMAALDRRLRRGERAMRRFDDVAGGAKRVASAIFGMAETARSRMSEAREASRRSGSGSGESDGVHPPAGE
ncbi:MAG: TetR/AcrR family transcriptional regulator, partial [Hyphomicrobiaceae bacterium]